MTGVFDPGLQPERTALAWRRTGLVLLGGSVVATRILPELLGPWSALIGLAGVIAAGILLGMIHRRYRRHHDRLLAEGDRSPIAGGRLIGATAAFAAAAGVVGVVVVAALALGGHLLV